MPYSWPMSKLSLSLDSFRKMHRSRYDRKKDFAYVYPFFNESPLNWSSKFVWWEELPVLTASFPYGLPHTFRSYTVSSSLPAPQLPSPHAHSSSICNKIKNHYLLGCSYHQQRNLLWLLKTKNLAWFGFQIEKFKTQPGHRLSASLWNIILGESTFSSWGWPLKFWFKLYSFKPKALETVKMQISLGLLFLTVMGDLYLFCECIIDPLLTIRLGI